jgi:hypothetical protein
MKIGKSESDKKAEDLLICRQITSEILNFGVSQDQILQIIYLLSLELEDREALLEISTVVKNFKTDILSDNNDKKLLEV